MNIVKISPALPRLDLLKIFDESAATERSIRSPRIHSTGQPITITGILLLKKYI